MPQFGDVLYEYDITTGTNIVAGYHSIKETYSDHVILKTFDKIGRLKYVENNGEKTTYTYDDRGNKEKVEYHSKAYETFQYNGNCSVIVIENRKPNGKLIDRFEYTYNTLGKQATLTHSKDATLTNGKEMTEYKYDSLGRLIQVDEPGEADTAYVYDKAGNMRVEAKTDGQGAIIREFKYVDPKTGKQSHRLYETTTDRMGALGSAIRLSVDVKEQKNDYDGKNQLVKTMVDGKVVENVYNGLGQRVSKKVGDKTTRYLYSGKNVIAEANGDGFITAKNVHGSTLISREASGEKFNYMFNARGDVVTLLSSSGEIKAEYEYDAFGNPIENIGKADNPYRYAAYMYDEETDMYYLNARMYDSKLVRFMQEDSYRGDRLDPLSLNLYTYTHNDPINYYDPSGHKRRVNSMIYSQLSEKNRKNVILDDKQSNKVKIPKSTSKPKSSNKNKSKNKNRGRSSNKGRLPDNVFSNNTKQNNDKRVNAMIYSQLSPEIRKHYIMDDTVDGKTSGHRVWSNVISKRSKSDGESGPKTSADPVTNTPASSEQGNANVLPTDKTGSSTVTQQDTATVEASNADNIDTEGKVNQAEIEGAIWEQEQGGSTIKKKKTDSDEPEEDDYDDDYSSFGVDISGGSVIAEYERKRVQEALSKYIDWRDVGTFFNVTISMGGFADIALEFVKFNGDDEVKLSSWVTHTWLGKEYGYPTDYERYFVYAIAGGSVPLDSDRIDKLLNFDLSKYKFKFSGVSAMLGVISAKYGDFSDPADYNGRFDVVSTSANYIIASAATDPNNISETAGVGLTSSKIPGISSGICYYSLIPQIHTEKITDQILSIM